MAALSHCANVTFAIIIAAVFSGPGNAEEVRIPLVSEQARASVAMPDRGVSQQAVLKRFGEPDRRTSPRGNPPISQWIYPSFSVYFEGDRVLHSVVPPETRNSKPSKKSP